MTSTWTFFEGMFESNITPRIFLDKRHTILKERHESVDRYIRRCRKYILLCKYNVPADNLVDQIIFGLQDDPLGEKLLDRKYLNLNYCIAMIKCQPHEHLISDRRSYRIRLTLLLLTAIKSTTSR